MYQLEYLGGREHASKLRQEAEIQRLAASVLANGEAVRVEVVPNGEAVRFAGFAEQGKSSYFFAFGAI